MDNYQISDSGLEDIYKAGLRLLTPLDLTQTLEVVTKAAMELIGGDLGSIFLTKEDELYRAYASDPVLFSITPRRRGYTYSVYRTGKPKVLSAAEIVRIHPEFKKTRAYADIIVPLTNQGRTIGILTVQSYRKQQFTIKDVSYFKLFGPLASLAIKKAQLYEEVKNALEMRDLFISTAAHELRTPLTVVNGYVQLLHNKLSGKGNSEARWAEQLHWETQRLTSLVNELLEINRIKSGDLNYHWRECSLREIIERIKSNFRFAYPERELVYEDKIGNHSDLIIGDYDKIFQVITNLVDNAVRFSKRHTPVTISLEHKTQSLILEVKDQGVGIHKNELPHIFEGYFRGGNKVTEGMGLGLYIVKDIVKRHHGEVGVSSKVGKGTSVKITIPKVKL